MRRKSVEGSKHLSFGQAHVANGRYPEVACGGGRLSPPLRYGLWREPPIRLSACLSGHGHTTSMDLESDPEYELGYAAS